MSCLKNSSFLSFDSLKSNQDLSSVDFYIYEYNERTFFGTIPNRGV